MSPHGGDSRRRVQAPAAEAKPLFLQYAALEEAHGLARAAMAVYDRAVRTVPEAERAPVYDLYLARAHELFGLGKARAPPLPRPCQACCLSACGVFVSVCRPMKRHQRLCS